MNSAHETHNINLGGEHSNANERPLWPAVRKGFGGKCPKCGQGAIFEKALTVADNCNHCDEAFHHHRADDLPAYLNIFVVGHVVVGVMMIVMAYDWLSLWPLTALTVVLAIVAAGVSMRPIKGMVVAAQWALRMHGFDNDDE